MCCDSAVYSPHSALALQIPDVVQDDRKLCFEILFAGVASVSNSGQVFTHAGDVEAGRELQQVLSIDPILQSGVSLARHARMLWPSLKRDCVR